jgi:L-alanine-DL-glutamate epimerase-like enolase superfamily enzyme
MERLLRETRDAGYRHFKLKVGTGLEQDRERLSIARSVLGYDQGNVLMVDANQVPLPNNLAARLTGRSGPFPRPSTG